ncbi:SigE family RNA polymerase sigma factor [Plantactinospora solaniradicis]|uniref:SigE family RNA polymerase sigma factor n=1 Tax=Plantactinospora solaniradicis TaxID=1723736 RepID=A0ABW1KNK4_9ACTN
MSFEEYVAWRSPALLRYAAVLTGDRDLAQDIVQEVLARVHGRWHRIARLDIPDAYVRRMITNEFLSWRRGRWTRLVPIGRFTEEHRPVSVAAQPDTAAVHAERDALLSELARLPRRQQAVLVLRFYEGMSDSEIADVLGCRSSTVRAYASRALATLRVELDPVDLRRHTPALARKDQ